MKIQHVHSVDEPAYNELLRIHRGSQPQSELKSADQLARMIDRPEYHFLVSIRNNAVVGYSISICFMNSDAALLEYMAVTRELRGLGFGQQLFRDTAAFSPIADRIIVIEVDSDRSPSHDHADRVRRKNFYRRLGCRQIDDLSHIMPPVSTAPPPPMDMLVYAADLPGTLAKSRIKDWLQSCYREVYQLPPHDARIHSMMANLPEDVRLI